MATSLRLSVGIPAFNQGDFLEQTIVSLLSQTTPPDEIVVSDHFSTDHTPDIIAKYARHVRGVQPPLGSNVGRQWDFTLSCLTGDWVTLFSSDDVACPNFIEVLRRGAQRREDAVLVRAAWQNIDRSGAALSTEYLLSVKPVSSFPDNLLEQQHGPKASFAAFAMKRAALEASGGYPLAMESFGDWPIFAQLAPYGSFIYEPEIVSGYRVDLAANKFRLRLGMWLRDEERMFYDILPRAAARGRMTDTAWIAQASRDNFNRYLLAAAKEFSLAERAEIAPLFASWAARVGAQPQLAAFAAGQPLRQPFNLKLNARRLLRPFAQNVFALFHKRKSF